MSDATHQLFPLVSQPEHPLAALVPSGEAGIRTRLEPLSLLHVPGLMAACDESCFRFHPDKPVDGSLEATHAYVIRLMASTDRIAFVVRAREEEGQPIIGITSFMDVTPAHKGVEIGGTWISTPYRGGGWNSDVKLTMLTHAFEEWGAHRVQLKCDARNVQSQRAIEKLGAVKEGVLRKHRIMPDGYVRDTVMFAIIREEWPGVRDLLATRVHQTANRESRTDRT
jgi:RimJ/RimL family protein N-acetyltransferase